MDINYILKVKDARALDIQKALQAAGIQVTSITEVYKEKAEEAQGAGAAQA
ncbi:MAG: hypothetical protein HZC11_09530 [Nitrospirae bacterium]|nr:hypothetical protein [Nitrospirota bacterium]